MSTTGRIGLKLTLVPGRYAVCRLESDAPIPDWFGPGPLCSATYTSDELSLIVPEESVPAEVKSEQDWAVIKVLGPLEFSLAGILASMTSPLAREGISIFASSTYDTDYILVKSSDLERAVDVLSADFDFVD